MTEHSGETFHNDEALKYRQLGLLRENLARGVYPGYPPNELRLYSNIQDFERTADGRIIIPDGPWTVNSHPNRNDSETIPSKEETQYFVDLGMEIDHLGRPLHPWFADMVEDPAIGVVTGKGAYWQWAENRTVDAVVQYQSSIALIRRLDTGDLALPGGFHDEGEQPIEGAAREFYEEIGIVIPNPAAGVCVYDGPVIDRRVSANAWPKTAAFFFKLETVDEIKIDPNEVSEANWEPIDNIIAQANLLFGSHRVLFEEALRHIKR